MAVAAAKRTLALCLWVTLAFLMEGAFPTALTMSPALVEQFLLCSWFSHTVEALCWGSAPTSGSVMGKALLPQQAFR